MSSRYLSAAVLLCLSLPGSAQQGIQTNRPAPHQLPLPKSDEAFQFIVFGDRTGGPAEGLQVLAQAVKDTNLLDPDLVMTVGDLINGYSAKPEWEAMAKDYRDIMQGLKMPWFPVAGNHDIYWRGPDRPSGEHEANYEQTFGPLWYWFEHKKCAFIVLFSDEGDGTEAARDFTNQKQQRISERQKAWLTETLEKTKGLKNTFVFLHHPRWVQKTYPGAQWDEVHDLLKSAGNVRAVFAGHVHRARYDGNRDGIDYITLATTGGSMPGNYPEAGFLHHMNLVMVRPEGIKVTTLPVGTVIDPKSYTPDLIADVESLRNLPLGLTQKPITLDGSGRGAGLVEFKITNPVRTDIEIAVTPADLPGEWIGTAGRMQFVLKPGETRQGSFSLIRVREGYDAFSVPSVEFRTELIREGGRAPLPPRKVDLPVSLSSVPEAFFKASGQKVLQLDGKSAIRVEMGNRTLPDGPFTVEARVKPAGGKVSGDIVSKAEQSEFAINLSSNVPGFHAFIDGRYVSAIATGHSLPADQWAHVAGVYDGASITLYVNGKTAAQTPVSGKRAVNPLPLYIGANPDAKTNPAQFLTGSVDEVRISSTARYSADFTPPEVHARDEATAYLFHCDGVLGPFLPSDSATHRYGTLTGNPVIAAP